MPLVHHAPLWARVVGRPRWELRRCDDLHQIQAGLFHTQLNEFCGKFWGKHPKQAVSHRERLPGDTNLLPGLRPCRVRFQLVFGFASIACHLVRMLSLVPATCPKCKNDVFGRL